MEKAAISLFVKKVCNIVTQWAPVLAAGRLLELPSGRAFSSQLRWITAAWFRFPAKLNYAQLDNQ